MAIEQTPVGIRIKVPLSYAEAVEKTTTALKSEGFGVLTTIDVKQTLKEKLGIESYPYLILGACNPPLAHRALTAEPEVGLLLPCNVIVYEDEGGCVVAAMDPTSAMKLVPNPELESVAKEVRAKLERVLQQVEG
ncbi:MAG: ABC transporter ATP-binding protein [Armatimonadota bacterium]